ncbi:MAG: molybdenum cofactor guanylyltransferase [bacterium]|nr:molybdenum cofactor guanylyltransferase [bacterium]
MRTRPRDGSEASPGIPVYILAGGKSRRYGSDKARADADGVSMIVRVADALKPFARSVTVVAAKSGEYDDLDLRTIGDITPDKGPMGGLLTALEDDGAAGWIFLSACDWQGIRSRWVERLLSGRRAGRGVVAFQSDRYDPLLAAYHGSILSVVAEHIERHRLEMQELLSSVNTHGIPHPADWHRAVNVNRPDEH